MISNVENWKALIYRTASRDSRAYRGETASFLGLLDIYPDLKVRQAAGVADRLPPLPCLVIGGTHIEPTNGYYDNATLNLALLVRAVDGTDYVTPITQFSTRIHTLLGGVVVQSWSGTAWVPERYFIPATVQEDEPQPYSPEEGDVIAISFMLSTRFPKEPRKIALDGGF